MREFSIQCAVWLPKPLDEVFAFFSDARNLELLTPSWLKFEILTEGPIVMAEGQTIDYRLRLRGIPVRWRSCITKWEPPTLFVDEQVRGPYRMWIHQHRFREAAGMTLAEDLVQYSVPGGWLADRLFVRRDLAKIFRFRHDQLEAVFGSVPKTKMPGATSSIGFEPRGDPASREADDQRS
ncbi:MAG: SRPBCC family protein [Bryobacterales bacterium]|nr:SRPBCC family protein [Bryobacterales bacterium]